MPAEPDLIREVLAAPAGVALLEELEANCRTDLGLFESIETSDPDAVDCAAESVTSMEFGELVRRMVAGAERVGGPWISGAPHRLGRAYRLASARTSIAAAVVRRFEQELRSDLDRGSRQWWTGTIVYDDDWPTLSSGTRHIHCCGEFTWNSSWTVSSPASEAHDDLTDMWEMYPGPISRWRIPIDPTAASTRCNAPIPTAW